MTQTSDAIFPRNFSENYPVIVRGEGVFLFDEEGKRYLDAGNAAVTIIGHGVPEIIEAARQAYELPYVHSALFHNPASNELASFLSGKFPGEPQHVRVHFTSGGSESTESIIKIARQYWLSRGQRERYKIIARWQGYHGTSLGALALSGNRRRREAYLPLLPNMGHIAACFCYRCPFGMEYPQCELACATDLVRAIEEAGPETVAAFILEPVVGASSGAVPPDGYLRTIREICDRYDILLIADEVLTGVGRTGKYFAVEHWGVVPDLILTAKGLSAGYSPLGAVLLGEKVWKAIEAGTKTLEHGYTYQDHPQSTSIGLAVQRFIEKHELVGRAAEMGDYLAERLERLRRYPRVGDVRGKGLLQTVEFVADRETKQALASEHRFVEKIYLDLLKRGVAVYPMRGTADGIAGEHIMIAPPYTIGHAEIDFLVDQIENALRSCSAEE
ncbi:MAG: aminotransferase class III-fold pyridoxal phosphate-dependent enzyme [Acidobacteriota bacterium]